MHMQSTWSEERGMVLYTPVMYFTGYIIYATPKLKFCIMTLDDVFHTPVVHSIILTLNTQLLPGSYFHDKSGFAIYQQIYMRVCL